MLSFLYVYSDHSILECYNLFSGVELSMRSFFVIINYQSCYELIEFLGRNDMLGAFWGGDDFSRTLAHDFWLETTCCLKA